MKYKRRHLEREGKSFKKMSQQSYSPGEIHPGSLKGRQGIQPAFHPVFQAGLANLKTKLCTAMLEARGPHITLSRY